MSKFFKQLFFFSILAVVIIASVHLSFQHRMQADTNYKVASNIQTLIIGNSRPECAFNDSLIANTRNLSLVAEPYFYTYIKLRKLLASNHQIQTVLVECSDINLSEENMKKWMYESASVKYLYPKYATIMTLAEKTTVLKLSPFAFIKSFPFILRDNILFTINHTNDIIAAKQFGGYLAKEGSHLDTIKNTTVPTANSKQSFSLAAFNLQYLDSIIALCQQHQVHYYLLRAPVHSSYGLASFDKTYDSVLANRYPNANLIDFANYKLDDSDFFDPHHLNYKGARVVSKKLDSVLRLLNDPNTTTLFDNHRIVLTH